MPHRPAIVTHTLGWVALLFTAFASRHVDGGRVAWLVLAAGWLVFAVLAVWSGRHILACIRALDLAGPDRAAAPEAPSRSWAAAQGYGPTVIQRRHAAD